MAISVILVKNLYKVTQNFRTFALIMQRASYLRLFISPKCGLKLTSGMSNYGIARILFNKNY